MPKRAIILPILAILTGCGDPLAGIERVSEMQDPPGVGAPNVLTPEDELNNDTPIFAGLFRGARNDAGDANGQAEDRSTVDGTADGSADQSGALLIAPRPRRSGPDARDVPLGTVLPFGQIARVCAAKGHKLGKLVEQAARRGARYKLYDTAPESAAPRTFYVKGFKDNCPRQFTASLALFGTPEMHEQLRYGLPAKEYPYSTTDKAYEGIKSQICGVARTKPCGPRISRLEKTTVFVSAYENFSANARWADMLIHQGTVLAASLKKP